MIYTSNELSNLKKKLSNLIFINKQNIEKKPTSMQIEKMINLCKKRNNPSYYKLRHASGMGEEYYFKGINLYSDDGKKMCRFESGLKAAKIRKASTEDAQKLSALVLSLEFVIGDKKLGLNEKIKDSFSEQQFKKRLLDEVSYKHFVYEKNEKIIAYITILNETHLYSLYVLEEFHGQGVGRLLWNYILRNYPQKNYSVNASILAIPFYEKLGFVKIGGEMQSHGVRYWYMKKN